MCFTHFLDVKHPRSVNCTIGGVLLTFLTSGHAIPWHEVVLPRSQRPASNCQGAKDIVTDPALSFCASHSQVWRMLHGGEKPHRVLPRLPCPAGPPALPHSVSGKQALQYIQAREWMESSGIFWASVLTLPHPVAGSSRGSPRAIEGYSNFHLQSTAGC